MRPYTSNRGHNCQARTGRWPALCLFLFLIGLFHGPLLLAGELETEETAVRFAREVGDGKYDLVTCTELKHWLDNNRQILIIDTMPYEKSYYVNHIPGAAQLEFPIPIMTSIDNELQQQLLQLLGPDKNRTVVFYCGFTACSRSHNGANWARMLGYKNVYRCPGGIQGWIEAGYPISTVNSH
ncbi:MAG: rhodanese-like domain-containing protein [Deltaproteobacteria bacterium]|nr:rhodanese-like domain-containing protein [Deltaproteobacteria bacterium]